MVKNSGRDRRDPRRQAVHVVHQVDGVGDADEPEQGDRRILSSRPGEEVHLQAGGRRDQPGHDLGQEFHAAAPSPPVVPKPHQHQQRSAGRHRRHSRQSEDRLIWNRRYSTTHRDR